MNERDRTAARVNRAAHVRAQRAKLLGQGRVAPADPSVGASDADRPGVLLVTVHLPRRARHEGLQGRDRLTATWERKAARPSLLAERQRLTGRRNRKAARRAANRAARVARRANRK